MLTGSHVCLERSARLIPEDDQIFTEVELNMLDKVINETIVSDFFGYSAPGSLLFKISLSRFKIQDLYLSHGHTGCPVK